MKLSDLKQRTWFKWISNKYVLILILFLIWMFFFDTNSWFIHKELNDDIRDLEDNKEFYQEEIERDKQFVEKMKDSNEQEKYAREKYFLKKEGEDIYIIEHQDSIRDDN